MEAYLFRKRIAITPPNSRGTVLDQRGKDFVKDTKLPLRGTGILAGQFPDGLTTIEGEPTPATVRVLYRPEPGAPGDGAVVAEVQSNQDGTWLVEGLNPELKFDVVGRKRGFNDVIMANVSPYSSEYIQLDGTFTVAKPERNALEGRITVTGGTAPYTVDVVAGAAPAGIAFSYFYGAVEAAGTTEERGDFEFTLRVTDANGVWAETPVELVGVDGHWDKVVALLHFDGDLTDETGRVWTGSGSIVPDGRFNAGVNTSTAHIQTPTDSWNDLSSGQGDFTVEMFIKQTAPNTAAALIAHNYPGHSGRFPFTIAFGKVGSNTASNQLFFGHFNGTWIGANSTWEPVSGQWHHIAASREGDFYRLFADGVLITSFTNSAATIANATHLYIGRRWDNAGTGNSLFQGVIDEFRITKGVARYTEDFTPPTAPF